jgi:HlyD family secretion protein
MPRGSLKQKISSRLFLQLAASLIKIFVTENDLVKKGAPLISVSNETSKITRENALLAANYADLSSNEEKLTDLKNNIALAQSKYSTGSSIFKRQQNLT